MTTIVGVRFREIGKIYSFDPGEETYRRGDHVIAETAKGIEYGTVILGNYEIQDASVREDLRPVLRRATPEDEEKIRANKAREMEALKLCRKKVLEHQLDMKVIAAEYTFDDSKILFFFTADGRVDFRDLVKDLASVFRMRIELRPVGVRDETRIVGGMGPCGRPLCCHSWLPDFVPVSIKMAKEQNLSLNPQKISGVCGRLMCCLKNEADTYAYLNSQLPKKGDTVELEDGRIGEITEVNVLKQTVRVLVLLDDDEREMRDVPAAETVFIAHRKKGQPSQLKKDAMARREAQLQEQRERKKREAEGADTSGEAGRKDAAGAQDDAGEGQSARRSRRKKGEGPAEKEGREGRDARNGGRGRDRRRGKRENDFEAGADGANGAAEKTALIVIPAGEEPAPAGAAADAVPGEENGERTRKRHTRRKKHGPRVRRPEGAPDGAPEGRADE